MRDSHVRSGKQYAIEMAIMSNVKDGDLALHIGKGGRVNHQICENSKLRELNDKGVSEVEAIPDLDFAAKWEALDDTMREVHGIEVVEGDEGLRTTESGLPIRLYRNRAGG